MLIKYIIIIFAIFAIYRATIRLKDKFINRGEYILWSTFWIIVIIATLLPKNLDKIAQFVGVERGADLAVYLSIVVIFYLIFKILTRQEKIKQEITTIVRDIALNNNTEKNEKNRDHID